MAGSISLSLSQQFDSLGKPLNGGLLYFYAAGTTTPQSAYQDSSLTLPYPNPITLDSAGRIPAFYLADGQIKIRLTNSAGVVQVAADNLLVVGASSGSGSAPTVDPTTILATGDIKARYGTGSLTGFVRANARTIGSATSGASERANADCQSLFEYLWGADSNLTVSTGRGASANADWVANKTIALPDWRGRTIAGLDDMGNSAAGVLTTATTGFGPASPIVLGNGSGQESKTLAAANLPPVTSTNASQAITVTSTVSSLASGFTSGSVLTNNGGSWFGAGALTSMTIGSVSSTGNNSISVTSTGTTSTAFATLAPTRLLTIYMKL
jgi:hypothetical protein